MTLASSGALTSAQINAETGLSNFSMSRTQERNLAGRPSGAYSWDSFNGQTGGGICTEQLTRADVTSAGIASFAAVAIGNPAWNREVFFLTHWSSLSSAVETNVTALSVNGVNIGDIHITYGEGGTSSFSNYGCAIISATIPLGTTATIAIAFSNSSVRNVYITPYRVTGLVSTVFGDRNFGFDETVGAGTLVCNAPLNVGSGGIVFYAATASSSGAIAGTATTGVTERQDQAMVDDGRMGNGFTSGLASQANRPVTTSCVVSVTGRLRLVTASFQLH